MPLQSRAKVHPDGHEYLPIVEFLYRHLLIDALADMKNPVYGNIILLGAVAATGELPINREDFEETISETMPADKVALNLKAYDRGIEMLK